VEPPRQHAHPYFYATRGRRLPTKPMHGIAIIGLDASLFGTHSLRRTKATLFYRCTGNLSACSCCWGTKRSRAQSATLESKSTTP
jgi:hypothetical protein